MAEKAMAPHSSTPAWKIPWAELNHFAVHLKLVQHCKSTILQLKMNTF